MWTLFVRHAFARMSGRISSIAAPVVPMKLASTVPIRRMRVFKPGLPTSFPFSRIPPAMVNSANSSAMKGMNSSR